ncbi:hypothetical protein TNCV_3064411 [Trichonephila clavipes]|nr:hypothetical protein TNCV_3064411 [Trichonephila clavipes]
MSKEKKGEERKGKKITGVPRERETRTHLKKVIRDVYGQSTDVQNLDELFSDTESDQDSDIYFDTESESFSESEN